MVRPNGKATRMGGGGGKSLEGKGINRAIKDVRERHSFLKSTLGGSDIGHAWTVV